MSQDNEPRNLALLREGEVFDGETISACPVCHRGILIVRVAWQTMLSPATGWVHLGRRLEWDAGDRFSTFCRDAHHQLIRSSQEVANLYPDTPALRAYFT